MANLITPPAFGPGSQPFDEAGAKLEYMEMPAGMTTFAAPDLPEPEAVADCRQGLQVLQQTLAALKSFADAGRAVSFDLTGLAEPDLGLINQVLGEGEVSIIGGNQYQAQESVLAGVWRVRRTDADGRIVQDTIEVASFPVDILAAAFDGACASAAIPESFGANVFNAPPLLPEINAHIPGSAAGVDRHTINLSLLPHTPEDLEFLDNTLGRGDLTVLSRGYGNCRVMTTLTKNVWWVQFFNSQETLILNSLEITAVPEVVCAAAEDIADSAERLEEILEVYR